MELKKPRRISIVTIKEPVRTRILPAKLVQEIEHEIAKRARQSSSNKSAGDFAEKRAY